METVTWFRLGTNDIHDRRGDKAIDDLSRCSFVYPPCLFPQGDLLNLLARLHFHYGTRSLHPFPSLEFPSLAFCEWLDVPQIARVTACFLQVRQADVQEPVPSVWETFASR